MACRFNKSILLPALTALLCCQLLAGCLTLRVIKVIDGKDVAPPAGDIVPGKATLGDVLKKYGAPVKVAELEGQTVLVYERSFYRGNQISFGMPFSDISGVNASMTGFGNLSLYDSLVFFINREGTVSHIGYEKGTSEPYWKTLFKD